MTFLFTNDIKPVVKQRNKKSKNCTLKWTELNSVYSTPSYPKWRCWVIYPTSCWLKQIIYMQRLQLFALNCVLSAPARAARTYISIYVVCIWHDGSVVGVVAGYCSGSDVRWLISHSGVLKIICIDNSLINVCPRIISSIAPSPGPFPFPFPFPQRLDKDTPVFPVAAILVWLRVMWCHVVM